MSEKNYILTPSMCVNAAHILARELLQDFSGRPVSVYGVPRGGVPVALMLDAIGEEFVAVENPEDADVFVDDLVDSGRTKKKYKQNFPGVPFYALFEKIKENKDKWYVFPWEGSIEASSADIFTRLLQYIGEDPSRGGLKETPERASKAWAEWTSGYRQKPEDVLKVFEDGAEGYDEMILVKDIPFYSHCEHHLAPFFGTVSIGYIPSGKIVGLSKLSRLVDIYAKRLQVQERMTDQIVEALHRHLQPRAVGVYVSARHLCMESRGIRKQGHSTSTSAFRGLYLEKPEAKAEFLSLAKG